MAAKIHPQLLRTLLRHSVDDFPQESENLDLIKLFANLKEVCQYFRFHRQFQMIVSRYYSFRDVMTATTYFGTPHAEHDGEV